MKYKILAVDDELHMLRLLEQLLRQKDEYDLTTTHNALEVPQQLEAKKFDIIITDLCMPGLSGMDILKLVRDRQGPEQVIIITAFGSLESAAEAFELGAFDYIQKPFKKDRLLNSIDDAIRLVEKCRKAKEYSDLLDKQSLQEAQEQLQINFIRSLSEQTSNNLDEIKRRTGLSENEINDALKRP